MESEGESGDGVLAEGKGEGRGRGSGGGRGEGRAWEEGLAEGQGEP